MAESRALGADAILVILAMIDDALTADLMSEAARFGMDALVEVHDEAEMDRAGALGATLVGVNNRDLRTFTVDLAITERLAARAPASALLVTESGIFTAADAARTGVRRQGHAGGGKPDASGRREAATRGVAGGGLIATELPMVLTRRAMTETLGPRYPALTAAGRRDSISPGGRTLRPMVQLDRIRTFGLGALQISPLSSSATTQIRWCSDRSR